MNISELSVKRPTLVVVVFTVLVFLGILSYRSLNYELIPEFSSPIFTVATVYPGAGPVEVENSVSKHIEEAFAGLPNIDVIRSISQEGLSMVIVTLKIGSEVDPIVNDAVRKIQAIGGLLPPQALEPVVTKLSVNALPVMTLSVKADMPPTELFDELDYSIKPAFAKIDGVAEITFLGATEREIQVNINHEKLDNHNLSILQVVNAIQTSNLDFPAGKITDDRSQTMLRMSAKFTRIPELADLVITQRPDGSLVKLKDLAEVIDAEKDISTIYRVNGEPAVGIQIKKQDGSNTVAVCNAIKEEISLLENRYASSNMQFSIPQDGSLIIIDAANSVSFDLMLAVILVTFVMLFFLHSGRNAVIVMIAVPLSIVSTFVGMQLFGYSLNLMTLLALSLVIGTLIDDAIVVLENIYRHLEMGKSRMQATIDGIREIGLSVVSITLVLVVVFLPVALSESFITPVIASFAMVIVISVLLSLLVAFTVVPLLTSRFSRLESLDRKTWWGTMITGFEWGVTQFSNAIRQLLQWSLRRKWMTMGIATAMFTGSLMLLTGGFIGTEFLNIGDVGECIVKVEYPKNYTIEQNNLMTRKLEEAISKKPEVVGIYTSVGGGSGFLAAQSGHYQSEINIKLVDKTKRDISSNLFVKRLEDELNETFPDVKVESAAMSLIGGVDDAPIQVVFQSTDMDSLMAFAEEMRGQIAGIPGTNNVRLSIESGNPEVVIRIDKEKMARLGLSPEAVGATIYTSFSGNTDSKFQHGNFEYDINVRLDAFNRQSISDVENLTFMNNFGQTVKLKQFASVTEETGPSQRERYGRISSILLESQVLGRAVGDVGNDVISLLEKTDFPDGITWLPEGEIKYQEEAFGSLGTALLIAIVLAYLIMVALYESFLHPFVVLFSIPLSIIGALLALALTGHALGLFSILGIIMLVGLVLKNAILVVDFTNHLRREGKNIHDALTEAVKLRFRPIVMTAISTVIGMLPIALSHGTGSEWKSGMGWVLIGGLLSSMLLSLIVVPVVYAIAEQAKSFITRTTRKKADLSFKINLLNNRP